MAEGLVFVFSFDFETHNLGRMRNILEVVKRARGRLCTWLTQNAWKGLVGHTQPRSFGNFDPVHATAKFWFVHGPFDLETRILIWILFGIVLGARLRFWYWFENLFLKVETVGLIWNYREASRPPAVGHVWASLSTRTQHPKTDDRLGFLCSRIFYSSIQI